MDKEGFEENMKRKKSGQLKKFAVTITVIMSILLVTAGLVLYERIQTMRMLLDKCATTQEAIEMLAQYDMHSSAGMPYHLLTSDKSGHTAVIEWPDQKMPLVDTALATNFQLSEGKDFGVGIGQDRFEIMENKLNTSDYTLNAQEAMKLLEDVKIEWNGEWATEWSVVYHMDDFAVDFSNDMDYDNIHHFSR